jgi:hypothetical protein
MFARKMPILFSSLKLHENLHNNDIGNEVYICCEIATMTNKGKKWYILAKIKHFKSLKQIQVVEHKVYIWQWSWEDKSFYIIEWGSRQ